VVDCTGLENRQRATVREFESHRLRQTEVALVMVSYDADWEVGRCAVYHRNTASDGKTAQPYVVDPYPHADSRLHLRVGTADLAGLPPAWYIGVTQMQKQAEVKPCAGLTCFPMLQGQTVKALRICDPASTAC
jgi:hypothetical protein